MKLCLLKSLAYFTIAVVFFSCTSNNEPDQKPDELVSVVKVSPYNALPDNEAGNTVRKAIDYFGGWQKWVEKNSVAYYKTTTYLDSTGAETRSVRQFHQYQLQPAFKARMSWEENGDQYVIVNNGQQAWKFKNGKEMTDQASKNQAWNSSFGSHYVFSMPFKLTDPGAILTFEGLDTLANGQVVNSVKVQYEEGAGSSGGMHDWWYFFDPRTNELVANFLDHGNGYSYTSYEGFEEIGGVRMQKKRHSYDTNENREIGSLQTTYENEDIQFNVSLDDALFEPLGKVSAQ